MRYLLLVTVIVFCCGCQTASKPKPAPQKDAVSAISTMTQGLTNQPITEQQLQNLAVQVKNNPQAQSAVRSINSALSAEHTVKYCPENGERFSPDMTYCPDGKVKLEWVE